MEMNRWAMDGGAGGGAAASSWARAAGQATIEGPFSEGSDKTIMVTFWVHLSTGSSGEEAEEG